MEHGQFLGDIEYSDFTFIYEWLHSPSHRIVLLVNKGKIGISRYKNIIVMNLGE